MCGNLISVLTNSFSRLAFWWRNPLPSILRRPRKPWYQYSRAIWSSWEVLNAIYILYFCASILEKNLKSLRRTRTLIKRQRGLRRVPLPAHIQVDASLSRQFHHQASFLRTKFSAFVLIVHEYSFNHLACEQAHFCKFGENFGCRRGKVTKKKAGLAQNCYRALLIIRYRIRTFKSGKRKLLGRSNLFEGLRCFIPALEVRSRKSWMK